MFTTAAFGHSVDRAGHWLKQLPVHWHRTVLAEADDLVAYMSAVQECHLQHQVAHVVPLCAVALCQMPLPLISLSIVPRDR